MPAKTQQAQAPRTTLAGLRGLPRPGIRGPRRWAAALL